MKRIYEYKCRMCGEIFGRLTEETERRMGIRHNCGGWGDYIISRPHFKEDIMSDRWVRLRESKMKVEKKNLDNHGTYD